MIILYMLVLQLLETIETCRCKCEVTGTDISISHVEYCPLHSICIMGVLSIPHSCMTYFLSDLQL